MNSHTWEGSLCINSLRPRQNGRHFADDIFKCIFLNENVWILIKISLKFVPYGPINNIPSLVQIMAWRRQGDKPLSEAMMVNLPTHICVTRPQWVKTCPWTGISRFALGYWIFSASKASMKIKWIYIFVALVSCASGTAHSSMWRCLWDCCGCVWELSPAEF